MTEARVGFSQRADGVGLSELRADRKSALVTQDGGGRYAEMARRGTLFWAANTAAQAISVALATTYTGLVINNPPGSTYHMALLQCSFGWSVAPAAIATIHLGTGYSGTEVTHTTPTGVNSCIIGSGGSVAKADVSATLPVAPKYTMTLNGGFTAGALPAGPATMYDLGGCIILPPGGFACILSLTASTGFGSFLWEEFLPGS